MVYWKSTFPGFCWPEIRRPGVNWLVLSTLKVPSLYVFIRLHSSANPSITLCWVPVEAQTSKWYTKIHVVLKILLHAIQEGRVWSRVPEPDVYSCVTGTAVTRGANIVPALKRALYALLDSRTLSHSFKHCCHHTTPEDKSLLGKPFTHWTSKRGPTPLSCMTVTVWDAEVDTQTLCLAAQCGAWYIRSAVAMASPSVTQPGSSIATQSICICGLLTTIRAICIFILAVSVLRRPMPRQSVKA